MSECMDRDSSIILLGKLKHEIAGDQQVLLMIIYQFRQEHCLTRNNYTVSIASKLEELAVRLQDRWDAINKLIEMEPD